MLSVNPAGVYLLHFDEPYQHVQHYVGFSHAVVTRCAAHAAGAGSPLLRAHVSRGGGFVIAKVWIGADRNFERILHKSHNLPRYCPVCAGKIRYQDYPGGGRCSSEIIEGCQGMWLLSGIDVR